MTKSLIKIKFPEEILSVIESLENPPAGGGFQAYLVGGCVRDILLGREPKDWDITTNAKPLEIQKIFPNSVYENKFGTVGVKTDSKEEKLKIIEITTFRLEGKYTDKRHPDEIKFAKTIEEDLSRRDFTVNAMAMEMRRKDKSIARLRERVGMVRAKRENERAAPANELAGRVSGSEDLFFRLIDPFNGQEDLKDKIIRTVGNPAERFNEDALRLMRAIRFAAELGFEIEEKTFSAIKKEAGLLEMIAKERIRDEFIKIIMTPRAEESVRILEKANLLKYIMPEIREGIGIGQNKHHIYSVWEHNLKALDYAAKNNYSLEIRLASLLHDVAKPRTKASEGPDSTFYNHEVVGAKMAAKILDRLHFSKEIAEKVIHLVRYHLFYYNVGEVTESGVRRFLRRVGPESIDDLIKVREADRIGSGVPKARPYKIRHLLFMIEKVKHDPISPKMLKINGEDVMNILDIAPGPKVGWILSVLLEEVIENPEKNNKEYLKKAVKDLGIFSDFELEKMAKQAREKKDEFEGGIEEKMKEKYYVK